MAYNNPIPVAVNIVPVRRNDGTIGLLGLTRGIEPFIGGLAFPGGFVDEMESIEQAATREFLEETGIVTYKNQWHILSSAITPNNRVLIFCEFAGELSETEVRSLTPTPEATSFVILSKEDKLCFSLHNDMLLQMIP